MMIRLDHENDGSRPSRLQIDRYLAGELDETEAAAVEAWLRDTDAGRAALAEHDAARAAVPDFDPAVIRERAATLPANEGEAPRLVTPANRPFPAWAIAALAVAAALVLVVGVWRALPPDGPEHGITLKGDVGLLVFELDDGVLVPWSGAPVGEGDTLGFRVRPDRHLGVVLLSMDGEGNLGVFWPERGDKPMPLTADELGLAPLPGTLVLDGAPGPEIFVAVFDTAVPVATQLVEGAWASGGADGVLRWAERSPAAVAVAVERR